MSEAFFKRLHTVISSFLPLKGTIRPSFGKIMSEMDADFASFAKEVHGLDADAPTTDADLGF